jgi:glyoxylase-like metal-dependent hydrolase (beta-lactamase superfamily II)
MNPPIRRKLDSQGKRTMKNSFRLTLFLSLAAVLLLPLARHAAPARSTLDILYVDVEGGAATLIVTPAGESILVDAGWPGFEGRDAKRIEAAMKKAGITEIDHLIMTHYHTDHYGGIPELAKRVKINKYYDHGPMQSLDEDKDFAAKYAAYQAATGGKSITLRPGSSIKLKQAAGTPKPFRAKRWPARRAPNAPAPRRNPKTNRITRAASCFCCATVRSISSTPAT